MIKLIRNPPNAELIRDLELLIEEVKSGKTHNLICLYESGTDYSHNRIKHMDNSNNSCYRLLGMLTAMQIDLYNWIKNL